MIEVIFKAVHLFGAFAWMAGMWYLPRILIYQREIVDEYGVESDRLVILHLMARRLLRYILIPSMVFTLLFGFGLAGKSGAFVYGWMHIKLTCILILCTYSFYLAYLCRQFQSGRYGLSTKQLRWLNEIPTVILIVILTVVVVYSNI